MEKNVNEAASSSINPGVYGETPVINLKFVRAKEGVKLQQGSLSFEKKTTNQPRLPLSFLVAAGVESTCAGSRLPGLLESTPNSSVTSGNPTKTAALSMGTPLKDAVKPEGAMPLPVDVGIKGTTGDPLKDGTPLVTVTHVTIGIPSSVDHDPTAVHKLSKKEREDQRAERERIKAEGKAKREEERLKREQEKQLREQEKKERQMKREQEAKERQEKREQEEMEKKERREKREAEKRKKDEEKQKKLEEKIILEREKEQKEEEKLRREEQAKMKFRGYFGKVEKLTVIKQEKVSNESMLTEFSIKDGMFLAKAPREALHSTSEFDELVAIQDSRFTPCSYIHTCKSISRKQTEKATEELDDSLIVISDFDKRSLPKFKLLQFKENHRPAYYGSWRRARGSITPRNPLRKDKSLLDYEVESDDEWEEEEPGESISSSEGEEKDGDAEGEDSDEDDGFFVPHGYLSNDEGDSSDCGEFITDPNEDRSESKRRKQLAKAWEAEFARKCQPLEAKVIGCLWPPAGQGKEFSNQDSSFLMQFAAVPLVSLPISAAPIATKGETSAQKVENQGGLCSNAESQKQLVPEEAMPDLIRFLHKSALDKKKIIRAFRIHWGAKISTTASSLETPLSQSPGMVDSTPRPLPKIDSTPTSTNYNEYQEYETASKISKRQMEKKIQAIAVKEIRPPFAKLVWYVHDSVLKQYGLEQETFAPLVPNGSPCLSTGSADQMPSRTFATPETPVQPKASKRKSGGMGKSLFHFLSRTPVNKSRASACPQHLKVGASPPPPLPRANDEVIILDPPVPASDELAEPQAKRQCHGNGVDVVTMEQDVVILDPPDPVSAGLGKPPAKKLCLETTADDCGDIGGVGSTTVDQNVDLPVPGSNDVSQPLAKRQCTVPECLGNGADDASKGTLEQQGMIVMDPPAKKKPHLETTAVM